MSFFSSLLDKTVGLETGNNQRQERGRGPAKDLPICAIALNLNLYS